MYLTVLALSWAGSAPVVVLFNATDSCGIYVHTNPGQFDGEESVSHLYVLDKGADPVAAPPPLAPQARKGLQTIFWGDIKNINECISQFLLQ